VKRSILLLLVIVSISWLGYVAIDLLKNKNNLDPEVLFNSEDKELLIILRPQEYLQINNPDFQPNVNSTLLSELNANFYTTAYFSYARPHCLLINEEGWDQSRINGLFDREIEIKNNGFKFGEYEGYIQKTRLYLAKEIYPRKDQLIGLKFDKKASALKCTIGTDHRITSRTEIYLTEQGMLTYAVKEDKNAIGRKVDDHALFSKYIPSNIDLYHFKEKEFWSQKDEDFANGPMFLWLRNGFVELEINGQKALISDFIEGQDPDLVLSDFTQDYDTTRFSVPLTNTFPTKGKSYTYQYLDGKIVFAEDKELCEKVVADHKLGNTLALDQKLTQKLFKDLPKLVSERFYSKDKLYARSVYMNEIHESIISNNNYIANSSPSIDEKPLTLTFGSDIHDFWFDAKNGTCIILGTNGKVSFFKNEVQKWTKELGSKPTTRISAIDLFDNGKIHYSFCTSNKMFVIAEDGTSPTGFPADIDHSPITDHTFYRWKANSFFLIPTERGLLRLDGKGRELNLYRISAQASAPPVVWSSQSKLYAGILSTDQFVMLDIEKGREHRKFSIKSPNATLKFPNELFIYEHSGNTITKVDQKGVRTGLGEQCSGIIRSEHSVGRTLILKENDRIKLTNENGIPYSTIATPTSDLVSVDISQTVNGKTIIALLDGLQNNVYLYDSKGTPLTKKRLEGQRKILIGADETALKVATVIDQFVVIYKINY
jgi:hypothetical protein